MCLYFNYVSKQSGMPAVCDNSKVSWPVFYMNKINFGLKNEKNRKRTPGRPSQPRDLENVQPTVGSLASSCEAGAEGHRAAVLPQS